MTVEDRVACGFVAVTAAVVGDLVGVGTARAERLRIEVVGIVVIGGEQPLVGMQVKEVVFGADMGITDLDMIVQVAVEDVGWIVGIEGFGRLDSRDQLAAGISGIGRHIDDHRRVSHRP